MNVFYLYYSFISVLICSSACLVFSLLYENIQGGIWAGVAALISGLCFYLHKLHFSNKLQYSCRAEALNHVNVLAFIIVLLASTFLIWYIFTMVYWKIPLFEYKFTPIFPCVFSFITGKWGLHLYTATKEYFSPNTWQRKNGFFNRFLIEDSPENFVAKSVFGFIGGILITYVCFMFLVFSLNFTLKRATYICMGLGVILSLGLAFSVKIRCTVFLCIPQLFSKRGRQALLAYAFILALSGPAKNTLHNVEVMSESLACGQEQLKQAENELLKYVQKPNSAAKKSIEKLLEKINCAVKYFKNFILQFYRNCFGILETILHAQKWLYSISLLCYKKMGKPAQRCLNILSEVSKNCESMSNWSGWKKICRVKPRVKRMICPPKGKVFCLRSDVPQFSPVSKLQNQLEAFKHRAMNILYVKVEAHQTYSQTNKSSTYHEEYQGVATEIRQKTDQFLQYFDVMSVIFGIFILVLFVKVIIYRHRFLTEDHYDNRFITSDFEDIDNARAEFQMETLLPLEPRERMKYIKVTSIRLVPCEKVRLVSSFVFLIFATFKIIIHMLTDSTLYWILSSVRRDERLLYWSTIREEEPSATVRVVGVDVMAALFRNVTKAVKRQSTPTRLDPTPCLPDPIPPDWNRYYQILALVLICWLLALCEPYGLRLRHTVMVTYHPDRARERAIWLYNRIISNRNSFFKIARREIRRKYKDFPTDAICSFQFMRKKTSLKCLLCKIKIHTADSYVKCPTVNCVGLFCEICFASLKFCSICGDPAEYGDLSDLSEEKDSSEEENVCKCGKKNETLKNLSHKEENLKAKTNSNCLLLNLRKPEIHFKKVFEEQLEGEDKKRKTLLQPTLLLNAVNYCFNKFPALRQVKNLSDVESSDWEFDTSMSAEDGWTENKPVNVKRLQETCLSSKNKRNITSEALPKSNSSKKFKKFKKKYESVKQVRNTLKHNNIERPESRVAVRLFQKMSTSKIWQRNKELSRYLLKSDVPFRKISTRGVKERPKPNFLFKKIVKGAEGDYRNYITDTFLKAKDSFQLTQRKTRGADLVITIPCNSKIQSNPITKDKATQTIIDRTSPLEESTYVGCPQLGDLAFDSLAHANGIFPFVDPSTILQFNSTLGLNKIGLPGEDSTSDCYLSTGKVESVISVLVQSTMPNVNPTPSKARICFKNDNSSSSESVRICIREESMSSSAESDCQFYSQPPCPFDSALEQKKTKSCLKRTSAKLDINVNRQRFLKFYSVETDSSNDKFMSVKPTRKVRRKKKTVSKYLDYESDVALKRGSNFNRDKSSKKAGFLKAKLVRFFKKNMIGRKSSEEEGTSDIDDMECMPNDTIFLSDEEFQKLSKQLLKKSAKVEDTGEKCNQLSWAPDLLSDLPYAKPKDPETSPKRE